MYFSLCPTPNLRWWEKQLNYRSTLCPEVSCDSAKSAWLDILAKMNSQTHMISSWDDFVGRLFGLVLAVVLLAPQIQQKNKYIYWSHFRHFYNQKYENKQKWGNFMQVSAIFIVRVSSSDPSRPASGRVKQQHHAASVTATTADSSDEDISSGVSMP